MPTPEPDADTAAVGRDGRRPSPRHWLTPEIIRWLRSAYASQPVWRTRDQLNERWNLDVTMGALYAANRHYGFGARPRGAPPLFTSGQVDWLIRTIPTQPYADTARQFAERWEWTPTVRQLGNFVTRHPEARGAPNTGWFRPGDQRASDGGRKAALVRAGVSSRFRPGQTPPNAVPLYTERRHRRRHSQTGRWYETVDVKVPRGKPDRFGSTTRWVRKCVHVWRQHHGPDSIPPGHAIVHLDGDQANCAIENLECVDRATLAAMNHYRAPRYSGPDAEPARVRLAQMRSAIARSRRSRRDNGADTDADADA